MATITSRDAKLVASLSKPEGRKVLINCLKCIPFDEEKDMRQSVHLDILYDNLMFASEKGFSWDKVSHVVQFADLFVQQIKGCDKITDILSFYNSKSTYLCQCLGERDFKIYSSFIFETILPHFKLYKLVFTIARQEQIPNVPLKVEPPFDTNSLKETKPVKVWDYERKIEELERKECERVNGRLLEKERKLSKLESETAEVLKKTAEVEKPLDKDTVTNIIQDVMKQYTLATTENLKFDIEHLQEDLEFKLEKTSVPRPPALGPPPRYNIQVMKTPSSKMPKSPKSESRLSGKKKAPK